jgi:UDPglucose--hexose-1-phosphate uridylyltransferase
MASFDPNEHPHTRYNPLKDQWVLVSPHRMKRPWAGQVEKAKKNDVKRHDPTNPLCPGATRPNGEQNPDYKETFVFDNDFPALFDYESQEQNSATGDSVTDDLFKIHPAKGTCKVMCFHPYSDLTLSTMQREEIVKVVNKWIDMYKDMSPKYEWVQIFENKGEVMGCSNPHPHCQVWASNFLPNEILVEDRTQREFFQKHNKVMLVEYLNRELASNERAVVQNEHWAVLVPYWAVWPYETMLLPKRHVSRIDELTSEEIVSLADIMKRLLVKYDNLFQCSFPYTMGFHFAPCGKHLSEDKSYWQFYASYLPPLLRSATVRKFMVGFELLAQPQRDLTPEKAALQLRELSDTKHYSEE